MVRTQIQLTERQSTRLRAIAARRGISMAEFIRQSVDRALSESSERGRDEIYRRAAGAIGRFRSGTHDGSSRHDAYAAEEYGR